jgi:hypothetical protein
MASSKEISSELLRKKQNLKIYYPKEKVTNLRILMKMHYKHMNLDKEHCFSELKIGKNSCFFLIICFTFIHEISRSIELSTATKKIYPFKEILY